MMNRYSFYLFFAFACYLSPLRADDIDIYIQTAEDFGLQTGLGNSSTITFILDDSSSMSGSLVYDNFKPSTYLTNEWWWDALERRTTLKNGFIDFISAAPGDLKIASFPMNEVAEGYLKTPGDFLSAQHDNRTSRVAGRDYRQRVVDDSILGALTSGVNLRFGRYGCQTPSSNPSSTFDCGSAYEYDSFSTNSVFSGSESCGFFCTAHKNFAFALTFPMPGFEAGSGSSAFEGRDLMGMFLAGFRLYGEGVDSNYDGLVDNPAHNAQLTIRVYNTADLALSSADGESVFSETPADNPSLIQPLVEFTTDYYPFGFIKDGEYNSANRYSMTDSSIEAIAESIKDGDYEELTFVIMMTDADFANKKDYQLGFNSNYVELHIEHQLEAAEVHAPVFSLGSDAIELSNGNVYDLNLDDPNPLPASSVLFPSQDMEELRLDSATKVALRFMLVPFDVNNDGLIEDIKLRVFPASALGGSANVTLGFNSAGDPGEIIPIEQGGITALWNQSNIRDTVAIDVAKWNQSVAQNTPYDIDLDAIEDAMRTLFRNSRWEYHRAITLVLTTNASSDLHFYSYEHSHAIYNQTLVSSWSENCLDLKQLFELRGNGVDMRMCERFVSPRLVFDLVDTAVVDETTFPSSQREKVIQNAFYFGADGDTPMFKSYANSVNYLYGYYGARGAEYESPFEPYNAGEAKACGFNDTTILLTDGNGTPIFNDGSYSSNTLQDLGTNCTLGEVWNRGVSGLLICSDWKHMENVAEYLTYTKHDIDGNQVPDNSDVFGMNSYAVMFGPKPPAWMSLPIIENIFNTSEKNLGMFAEKAGTALYENGDPKPYQADNSYSLVQAFRAIQADALVISSQVSTVPEPIANPVNSFETSDELYYPLYKPNDQQFWPGNLKRYSFNEPAGSAAGVFKVVDVNLNPVYFGVTDTSTVAAVDPDSVSWWTDEPTTNTVVVTNPDGSTETYTETFGPSYYPDGQVVSAGGAAQETDDADRNLYTYIPNSAYDSLDLEDNELDSMLPQESLRGHAGMAIDVDEVVATARGAWGSVIHNRPKIVSQQLVFKDSYLDDSINTVYFGDNAGYLHAIDAGEKSSDSPDQNKSNTGGTELWAFAPVETLGNFARLTYDGDDFSGDDKGGLYRTRYLYGVDGDIQILAKDSNRNGNYTDTGDYLNLYFGLRRGGSAYYGLDISTSRKSLDTDLTAINNAPKLKFRLYSTYTTTVMGDTSENIRLDRLAETWSPIATATIQWQGQPTDVIIFGGGYDSLRNESSQGAFTATVSTPQLGNAIYVVDAQSGQLYGYVSNSDNQSSDAFASGATGIAHTDMVYSIPGQIGLVDYDRQGVDYLYAADTGGQVFRISVNKQAGSIDAGGGVTALFSSVTKVASIGRATAIASTDKRSIFEGVDAAIIESGPLKGDIAVVFGSGFRPELKLESVIDYFFAYIDPLSSHGMLRATTAPFTQFADITSEYLQNDVAADLSLLSSANVGWRIQLQRRAEKMTGSPKIVRDRIFASTFDNVGDGDCSDSIGNSNAYAMHIDGTALFESGRIIDSNSGMTSTGSVIVNPDGSLDTYFLANTKAICLEGNCLSSGGAINEDTNANPPPFIQDIEALVRTKWRRCIDSNFIDCGSGL
ncbi:MAG: hypothetical protein SVC26_02730 [Pseudomonadota bacterium]|nr:hypothetical protein [Pseudomonadota bacterium]